MNMMMEIWFSFCLNYPLFSWRVNTTRVWIVDIWHYAVFIEFHGLRYFFILKTTNATLSSLLLAPKFCNCFCFFSVVSSSYVRWFDKKMKMQQKIRMWKLSITIKAQFCYFSFLEICDKYLKCMKLKFKSSNNTQFGMFCLAPFNLWSKI